VGFGFAHQQHKKQILDFLVLAGKETMMLQKEEPVAVPQGLDSVKG
jgi:hypothetical protein